MIIGLAGLFASMAMAPVVTIADSAPPPGQITIAAATVNGSSCRPGTTAVAISADKTAFTVLYSAYLARVGARVPPAESHRKCKLNIEIKVPHGYTYAVVQADQRGYALLQAGATATQRATYRFQGDPPRTATVHQFTGPYDDFWQTTDTTPVASRVYAPCGKARKINIDTELRVGSGTSAPGTGSFVAMDSTDGSVNTTYRLAWKTCAA